MFGSYQQPHTDVWESLIRIDLFIWRANVSASFWKPSASINEAANQWGPAGGISRCSLIFSSLESPERSESLSLYSWVVKEMFARDQYDFYSKDVYFRAKNESH